METGIAALVCYAGVFGDVIGVEEMATRLGVADRDDFYSALNSLHRTGRIIVRDGFASLPNLGDKIGLKKAKIEAAEKLIAFRRDDLRRLGRNPLIKFVGISGSLAAGNPTYDKDGRIDIDLFMISRSQCLWLYIIPRNIRNLFPRKTVEPVLCDNFIMDEGNVRVTNRNFFTATDIRNLIPVSGISHYRRFLQENSWIDYYYPGFSGSPAPVPFSPASNHINKALYFTYILLYCAKHRTVQPLRGFSFGFNPHRIANYDRITQRCGGYQALVQSKFTQLAASWFHDHLDARLIGRLFPDELSEEIRREQLDYFRIQTALDYSKYA